MRAEKVMLDAIMHVWKDQSGAVFSDEYVIRFQTDGYCQVLCNKSLVGVEDEIVSREIAHHRSIGRDFEWAVFSVDEPSNFVSILEARGFEVGTKEVTCMFPLADYSSFSSSAIRVDRVTDATGLADFKSVAEAVFGKDYSYTTRKLVQCLEEGLTNETGFVAYCGDIPVSIGRLSKPDEACIAGLYTGGTLAEHRGKGYYRAVVNARAIYARELGMEYLSVDAKPTSLPILQQLGFVPVVESWPCEFTVGTSESESFEDASSTLKAI